MDFEALAHALPPRASVAWVSSIVESVFAHFSPYFRRTFKLDAALDTAWRFAEGEDDPAARKRLGTAIGKLAERADGEGYGTQTALIAMHVLGAWDGMAARAAIEDSARAFADQQLWRQRLTDRDVSPDCIHAMAQPVLDFALRAHEHFRAIVAPSIRREHAFLAEIRTDIVPMAWPQRLFPDWRPPPWAGDAIPPIPPHEIAEAPSRVLPAMPPVAPSVKGSWRRLVAERRDAVARPYAMEATFHEGELVEHARFGRGLVVSSGPSTIEVLFEQGTKKLRHTARQ
jgi:hypothetical protein